VISRQFTLPERVAVDGTARIEFLAETHRHGTGRWFPEKTISSFP